MNCSQNATPSFESLDLPRDINIGLAPYSNQSMAAMQHCCSPNPVSLVKDCTLWCELPDSFMDDAEKSGKEIPGQLSDCFGASGLNVGEVVATGGHEAESLGTFTATPTIVGLVLLCSLGLALLMG